VNHAYHDLLRAHLDAAHARHCALIEALSRLCGFHAVDGAVPLDKLQAVIDRDLARGREGGGQ
jgi:hypothetical protein